MAGEVHSWQILWEMELWNFQFMYI